jgi:hypothetical protein
MRFVNRNSLPLYAEETVAAGDGHNGVLHAGCDDSTPGIRRQSFGLLQDVRGKPARPSEEQVRARNSGGERNGL